MPIFPGLGITPSSFRPMATPPLFYCGGNGNDNTGDGRTPASAYRSATLACQAASDAGGGKIIIMSGAWASHVSGQGLYLRSANDTGPGGLGWVDILAPLEIEFVPSAGGAFTGPSGSFLPGGGAADYTGSASALWITGINAGLNFKNGYFNSQSTGPALRLGLSSPITAAWDSTKTYASAENIIYGGVAYDSLQDTNLNHQPDTSPTFWKPFRAAVGDGLMPSLTSVVRFDNCGFSSGGDPGFVNVDIGGGFWYWFDHCGFDRFRNGDRNQLTKCAVRIYSDVGGSTYLNYYSDCIFGGMGIYSVGANETHMYRTNSENQEMPLWHGVKGPTGDSPRGNFEWCTTADAVADDRCLFNEGETAIRVVECFQTDGPAYFVKSWTNPQKTLAAGRQYGQNGELLEARVVSPGLLGAPTSARYPNIAQSFPSLAGGTFEVGPHGEPVAAQVAKRVPDDTPYWLYWESFSGDAAAVGDYYTWGLWFKPMVTASGAGAGIVNAGADDMSVTGSMGEILLAGGGVTHASWFPSVPVILGKWTYISGWLRVISLGADHNLEIFFQPPPGYVGAGAWCYHIPAADGLTDSDVAEMAQTHFGSPNVGMGVTAKSPATGMVAITPGLKLAFYDATLAVWKYLDIDNGTIRIT